MLPAALELGCPCGLGVLAALWGVTSGGDKSQSHRTWGSLSVPGNALQPRSGNSSAQGAGEDEFTLVLCSTEITCHMLSTELTTPVPNSHPQHPLPTPAVLAAAPARARDVDGVLSVLWKEQETSQPRLLSTQGLKHLLLLFASPAASPSH